ncbi:uncharacterized protein PODANS_1_10340 [Podospora anserina S mat+]|uniref:Podospora anserina S mat+ genomic DNA chromosome 1, supercontig 2 n=1 Tax=Podospora anserina (strain S / ATCC MYA-4624 / DSM 980 / FGSC 10383) TaxID=515849 RepID=B2AY96_PODAN|nr:uncharacterized protein PODANS_1_10340 [Podospora anserina S mat+]CAP69370.1 unnamed protein product [Podospora anserina S mat+]CDP23391.1 Putative protein of unknown function [Podospora anserina S mat+]
MMAAPMPGPLSFNPQIPVTPPPDHHMFMKGLFPPNAFQQPGHHNHNHQHHSQPPQQYRGIGLGLQHHEPTPSNSTTSGPHIKSEADPPSLTSPRPSSRSTMQPPPPQLRTSPTFPPSYPSSKPQQQQHQQQQPGFPPSTVGIDPATAAQAAVDPRYIAMASRIASYYQQRCQAVANFQQQRCQQWAAAQRAKCQEMTQAAMLVVAWYIRDRINRRRKRQKKTFKRALNNKNSAKSKVTKGETVRNWVMGVPLEKGDFVPGRELPKDEQERDFDMDRMGEREEDRDGRLFEVADGLIKSQLARVEVPFLGLVGFEESESEESESESEMSYEEEELEEGEEYEEEEEKEEEYEEEEEHLGMGKGKEEENTMGSLSKDAQLGTVEGTDRRKSRDSSVL